MYETVKAQQHIEQLEATNERLTAAIQAKANYGKICDSLRQAEGLVQRAQAELDSRIDQLKIVAFGLPAFDQIMADIFTTEKKERPL